MKKILGLDIGTNSIGWALIEHDLEAKQGRILGMGSRIIPMSQDVLSEFEKGNSVSQTAERTRYRGVRRLRERHLLRRERLHRVLHVLGFLPEHYAKEIDFEKHPGKFLEDKEPKLTWRKNTDGKYEFLFQKSYQEMLDDFRKNQPSILNRKNKNGEDAKIPYDWTIYYLRKKALTKKIEKEELAWLILNFNQKRGYYQLRGEEEEETTNKREYVLALKVVKIEKDEKDKKNPEKNWYNITLENGWIYRSTFSSDPSWLNTVREFLITEELDEQENIKKDKEGKEKRQIKILPSFEEIDAMPKAEQDRLYKKIKIKTENAIEKSGKTVGEYIYDTLLQNLNQKIRGKLIRTIERKFYKDELTRILRKQIELQPELFTEDRYNECIRELYRSNNMHQQILSKKDFVHLFVEDIIFYQRPLRSQKSLISNCSLEFKKYEIKDHNGNKIEEIKYLKAIPKSHPLYQEFRIWQWLSNLKIYRKDDDTDVTKDFLKTPEDYEKLFEFLMTKREVTHVDILRFLIQPILETQYPNSKKKLLNDKIKQEISKYRWNYVFDDSKEKEEEKSKKYPCNETGYEIRKRLEQVINVPPNFLSQRNANQQTNEEELWHIIYSVKNKEEYKKALRSFAKKKNIDISSFEKAFEKFPPFKPEYGSYSAKAIKKLLPLMRCGKYWNWENIDTEIQQKIDKVLTGEYDDKIKNIIREKAIDFKQREDFQRLPEWFAKYLVYNRHSEISDIKQWKNVEDLNNFLNEFKQHSLRNPIVEQIVLETLRVVRDIWKKYGNGAENFFDEIHIELGRELKNPAEERKKLTSIVNENENTNLRIKALLIELAENTDGKLFVENVRPHSPMQQEILKIYEDGVLSQYSEEELKKEKIYNIAKSANPSKSELIRYKLWLEQKYRSPYTNEVIPLSKLFTSDYEIEHIIPQSRYFDDSLSNKVICEAAVNKLKDNQLALEFIKNHHGEKVDLGLGRTVEILSEANYRDLVKKNYDKNPAKRKKLLMEEIPEKMIARQLNDTRYISKFVIQILSNIVRDTKDDSGLNSKNIIACSGKVTDTLKQEWGLNDVWNEIILPRFERLNQLTNSSKFTTKNKEGHIIPNMPFELSKGFSKKRIDHRHHAMDALVIACTTREHVQYLNNENARSQQLHLQRGLAKKIRKFETVEKVIWEKNNANIWQIKKDQNGKQVTKIIEVPKDYYKPWETFTTDAKNALENIVVSFKQNLRIINKATNYYEKYVNGKKTKVKQEGINWAIRKPLHKESIYGKVNLPHEKVSKDKVLTAIRKSLNTTFNLKAIEKITDTGIQKILLNYLKSKNNNPEIAFSAEGIEELNKNIIKYNDGKFHQPIYKVRIFEEGNKFPLGQRGNKKSKYVEAAKGTNLYFAIYQDEKGNRTYETIPLNIAIDRLKNGFHPVPEKNEKGNKLLFYLSPNDLVYIPTREEWERIKSGEKDVDVIDFENLTKEQRRRIYKFTDGSGTMANFIPVNIAEVLFNMNKEKQKKDGISLPIQNEIGVGSQGSKSEKAITGEQIKSVCIKLKVDRLGNISKASR